MRRTCYAEHVVDAHQRIGHNDGFHGAPKRRGGRSAVFVTTAVFGQQLVCNP